MATIAQPVPGAAPTAVRRKAPPLGMPQGVSTPFTPDAAQTTAAGPTSMPAPPAPPMTTAPTAPETPAAAPAVGATTPGQGATQTVAAPPAGGPTYGPGQYQGQAPDFNRLGHGDAVEGLPGYSWYHNGSGWIQAPTGQAPAGGGASGGAAPPTIQGAYESQLRRLLEGPTAEEAGAAAGDSPEARAYRAAQQRDFERATQQLAEDNAYGGGDVANPGLTTAKQGLRQQQGEAEGQFLAKLTDAKMQQRRDELLQAMQMAATKGDNEAARALQLKIAEMDAAARNRATDVQRELGLSDVDTRRMLGLGDLDVRRYGIDVGRGTALDQIGFDYASLQQRANADTLRALGF